MMGTVVVKRLRVIFYHTSLEIDLHQALRQSISIRYSHSYFQYDWPDVETSFSFVIEKKFSMFIFKVRMTAFTHFLISSSKSLIETIEKGVKYVQSSQ